MELTGKEKQFLYDLLDQVSVRGLEQKQIALTIMVKLAEEIQKETKKTKEKP